jgi:hypothetical protein
MGGLLVGRPASLAAGRGRFLRRELMRRAFLVSDHAAFPSGGPGLFGSELVGGAFLVCRLATLAGDLPLFSRIHGAETPVAFACHDQVLSLKQMRLPVALPSEVLPHCRVLQIRCQQEQEKSHAPGGKSHGNKCVG